MPILRSIFKINLALNMKFRVATTTDAHSISGLIQRLSQSFVLNPDGAGAEQFWAAVSPASVAACIDSPGYQFIVAINNATLVAVMAMRDEQHIHYLFVAPDVQRQGLANKLLSMLKNGALHGRSTRTFTVNSSLPAVRVYQRFGFTVDGSVVINHGISFQPMIFKQSGVEP
jgi:ribosomal protein S18 acetylase RimI-like enzyme